MSEVKGLDELMGFLTEFPEKFQRNVLRGAAKAAANVVADEAKIKAAGLTTPGRRLEGGGQAPGRPIADDIKVGGMTKGGVTGARVYLRGVAASAGIWAEYGTLPHLISVREEDRPVMDTRTGSQRWSIRKINKAVREGHLLIGSHFVGPTVHHPGAIAHPFLLPAVDSRHTEATAAAAAYINSRMTKEGLNTPDAHITGDEE